MHPLKKSPDLSTVSPPYRLGKDLLRKGRSATNQDQLIGAASILVR